MIYSKYFHFLCLLNFELKLEFFAAYNFYVVSQYYVCSSVHHILSVTLNEKLSEPNDF